VTAALNGVNTNVAGDLTETIGAARVEMALGNRAKQVGGSTAMLARVPIVLAVKQGAPSPDISSVEAFKRTLLNAKSIAYIDPASRATSGIHLAQALVEDDEDVRNFTRTALISLGYRVYEASDAVSGLEVLAEHRQIALLLSDVGLPGMNGRRLAEEARARRPEIKVLYTTGYARNAIVHHGLVDPGVELLPKPYTIQALGRKVRQVIES